MTYCINRSANHKPFSGAYGKIALIFIFLLTVSSVSRAQTNIAPAGTAKHSGGGSDEFAPSNYNDGVIPTDPASYPWGWVTTNGWIEYTWSSKKSISKVVFYYADRPMTSCVVQYWDGAKYVNVQTFTPSKTGSETLTFSSNVVSTRLRFSSLAGFNPNFREIQVYGIDYVGSTPTAIALSASSIDENVAANTVVGTFTTTDANVNDAFTYSLVAGDGDVDNNAFSISGNSLKIKVSPDFEAKNTYSIRVRTTDQDELYYEKILSISVADIAEAPVVTSAAQKSVTSTSAVLGGEVTNDQGETITDRGIVWSVATKPTVADNKVSSGMGKGSFSETINDLPVNTIIYVRAFATNSLGTGYGAEISFSTRNIQSISFSAIPAKTYGDADFDAGATASSSLGVTYSSDDESVAKIVGGKIHIVGVGETTITASQLGNGAFDPASSQQQTLIINKRSIEVTADARSKTYGDSDPDLTFTHVPALVGTDSFSGKLSREAGENADTYDIAQGDLALNGNYTVSFTPATFTINKKVIAVTAEAKEKTYGDTDPELTFIHMPALVGTDSFSGKLSRSPGENVDTYAIHQNELKLNDNYTLNYTGANLTVRKKVISVNAEIKSKTYGDSDPELTYTYSPGLIGTDKFSGSLNRETGENTGTYAIKQNDLALSSNYTINYTEAGLTVNKKAIAVSAEAKGKTYGDSDPALTYTFSPALIGSDSFSGKLSRERGENVGPYVIEQGTLALSGNYLISYTGSTLTISKKAISVAAEVKSKTYGDIDPELTFTHSPALIGTDSFSGKLNREPGEDAGSYSIGQGTLALNSNYIVDYTGSKLTIEKKAITVTAENKSKTYGDSNPLLTVKYTGLANNETALSPAPTVTTSATELSGVGEYDIVADGTSKNYTIAFVKGKLAIGKKAITVTAEAKTKTYGEANPLLTVKYTGLVNGETVLSPAPFVTTSATELSGVGEYDIEASGTSANYDISFVKAKLAVTKKKLTVKADDKQKYQSTANPALTVSYEGFANNEGPSDLLTLATASSEVVLNTPLGTYDIVASGASSNNYSFDYIKGVFEVKPGHPTSISLAASTVYENQAAGTLAGTLSSTSDDPSATFKYTLVKGFGDNDFFEIVGEGTQLTTKETLNFENKASYSIKVRSTTQHNLWLEKEFTIDIVDVNEQPTLADIAPETICYTTASQLVSLKGISAGPDGHQSTDLSISSSNNSLFEVLEVNQAINGQAELRYVVNKGASGSAVVNVLVTDDGGTANGGVNSILKSFTITVNPLPVVTISSDKGNLISKGDKLNLTAAGGVSYQWSNAEGIIEGQNSATLTVRPSVTTTYRVTATNATHCSEVQEFTVTVNEDYQMVSGTNLVTPNGDGVNDNFVIRNLDMYPNNEVKIFDRAGRLLYSKKNYSSEWNGTFNGAPLAEDTYYYIVDFGSKKPALKGFITIVRD